MYMHARTGVCAYMDFSLLLYITDKLGYACESLWLRGDVLC